MEAYKTGWEQIVKPPRYDYHQGSLGSKIRILFNKNNTKIYREDFEVINLRNNKLQVSFFSDFELKIQDDSINQDDDYNYSFSYNLQTESAPIPKERNIYTEKPQKPCLVYLHSHNANRLEGLSLLYHIVPDYDFCVFDFNGCGLSEGDYVTLGIGESEDTVKILAELKLRYGTREFFLWGRSMGAVTSMYVSKMCDKQQMIDLNKYTKETGYQPEVLRAKKYLEKLIFEKKDIPVENLTHDYVKLVGCVLDCPFTNAKKMVRYTFIYVVNLKLDCRHIKTKA